MWRDHHTQSIKIYQHISISSLYTTLGTCTQICTNNSYIIDVLTDHDIKVIELYRAITCNNDHLRLGFHQLSIFTRGVAGTDCSSPTTIFFHIYYWCNNPYLYPLIVVQCYDVADNHIQLAYDPFPWNAVTCSPDHIFVSTYSSSIYIHTWSGRPIQSISQQQLGLQEDQLIQAIKYNNTDRTLHLAVGYAGDVRSLHVYKVSKH